MHVFFSGIGGTGIGPLALIAHQAGYHVSGSDKQASNYIEYLQAQGLEDIHIGQSKKSIEAIHAKKPIDWLVHSSAVHIENPNHPELVFARENNIKTSKRDELLNQILKDKKLKLIAIAGTHGKTTTTAMVIWLFKQLGLPISYSVGAKISFGDMGAYDPKSQYFVYECDEYDRNFLSFHPYLSLITGIAHDHHDIYPNEEDYFGAFRDFLGQSQWKILWPQDKAKLGLTEDKNTFTLPEPIQGITLAGEVNKLDGSLAVQGTHELTKKPVNELVNLINNFPGVSRRFEKIAEYIYSDYAHTPEKIAGCLDLAREKSKNVVVVYEPLTNKRQHSIKTAYKDLFRGVKKLYWVPSYLTREDPNQHVLSPKELIQNMGNQDIAEPRELDDQLQADIKKHQNAGDLVVCISGGGGGSLDEWIRQEFSI